jgi:myo-inositol catabolism protein IolS
MKYRTLGRTGLEVSEIGFGAWAIGGPAKLGQNIIGWGRTEDEVSLRALEASLDEGINFYDTADVYGWGHSEELIGKTFRGKRHKVIIASKVGNRVNEQGKWVKDFSRSWVFKAIEESLHRLQTDYLDLYQLHSPDADFSYSEQTFEPFEELKRSGKIRFYGVSIGPIAHGLEVAKLDRGDLLQVAYHLLKREAEQELYNIARERNLGIIARVPLASGFLAGKLKKGHQFDPQDHRSKRSREQIDETIEKVERLRFLEAEGVRTLAQAALQFCISQPAVSTCIPGAKDPDQVRMNAGASNLPSLTREELNHIDQALS